MTSREAQLAHEMTVGWPEYSSHPCCLKSGDVQAETEHELLSQ